MTTPEITALHDAYVTATGLGIRLSYERERAWYDYRRAGFTREDLMLVVRALRIGIGKGERNEGALRFRNLIVSLDHFEEELAAARKHLRPARPATKQEPLTGGGATRLVEVPSDSPPALSRDAVLASLEDIKRQIQSRPKE